MAAVNVDMTQSLREVFRKAEGFTRDRIPRAARKAMNAGGTEFVKGIRREVPKAKTKGHSSRTIKMSAGKKVKRQRDGYYGLKVGIGVGKKRGQVPKHSPANVAGTVDRFTGQKKERGKVTQTGNARKFRGHNKPMDVVAKGVAASEGAAQAKMVEVAQREMAREASSWEQAHGIR